MCCVAHRNVRLTRGPCSPETVRCSYSDCARPSMTRLSPWSSLIGEETPHPNLELHRMVQAPTYNALRLILWAEQGLVIAVQTDTWSCTSVLVQFHSRWHIPSCTPKRQVGCDPAPQTMYPIPDGGVSPPPLNLLVPVPGCLPGK